jgi:hypothetical protein
MFNLINVTECFRNLQLAAALAGVGTHIGDYPTLKAGYRQFLSRWQPLVTLGNEIIPEFIDCAATERLLMEAFIEPPIENDILDPITAEVIDEAIARRCPDYVALRARQIERAREALYKLNPLHGRLFDLTVTRLFCVDVPRNQGGSTARAVGVIWVNTPATATVGDMVEFLVHEMTHHVIFLDNYLHGHYTRFGQHPDSVAVSAIRGVPRPLPCVLDSLLVSVEVLSLRAEATGEPAAPKFHPRTEALWSGTVATLDSIHSIPDWESMLLPRGRFLLDRAEERLYELTPVTHEQAASVVY